VCRLASTLLAVNALGLLELVLEVRELDRSVGFYRDLLGMREVVRWGAKRPAVWLELGRHQVLGLWPTSSGGRDVAIHSSRGGAHVHFAVFVGPGSLGAWKQRLEGAGLAVEGPVQFEQGASLFVDDPDGNVLELADWSRDWEGEPVNL
jgi:catechol 2,3-dioxygenase-like lactoylglutathione lyase family enzyme